MNVPPPAPTREHLAYRDNSAYLVDELNKLDLLLRMRVSTCRALWHSRPADVGHPLHIPDAEVDWLLEGTPIEPTNDTGLGALRQELQARQEEIDERVAESLRQGVPLGLPRIARLFDLSPFEVQAILICLAPELRRRYDRIYAYLQDDIARQRPSVNLVLELLCTEEEQRWIARALLAPQAPLRRNGLLQAFEDAASPSGSSDLAQLLRIEARILDYLLSHATLDDRLIDVVGLHHPTESPDEDFVDPALVETITMFVHCWVAHEPTSRQPAVVHVHGPQGVGKQQVALAACRVLESPLLHLDTRRLPPALDDAQTLLTAAFRESLLLGAPLYLSPDEPFDGDTDRAAALRTALTVAVARYGWLTFLGGARAWRHPEVFSDTAYTSIAVPMPNVGLRTLVWLHTLQATLHDTPADQLAGPLAARFRLTPGQIRAAARAVADQILIHSEQNPATFETLAEACRAQAQHDLAALASKIEPRHTWQHLIVPADTLEHLRQLCSEVRYEPVVHDDWGFGRHLSRSRGVSVLFSGPPGTGKTMAAEVIANDLQLDLYRIDLAGVVSKYIGETEKNLARVFTEAEGSNAILFFDEADALFGKRTEISDAHDRYANLETSFLLQQMEDYAGVVILASNLRDNMDAAFLRRLRYVVEFPFPDVSSRLRIWEGHMPAEAPVAKDVDYALLAERIPVAGGNIRNIVLNAAFFAAADGGEIGMKHVLSGARREFRKIGKLWDEDALKQHQLVTGR
jgi:hypothetical protein